MRRLSLRLALTATLCHGVARMEGDDGDRERYQQATDDQGSFSGKAVTPSMPRKGLLRSRREGPKYGLFYDSCRSLTRTRNLATARRAAAG